jgi:hypothetical protein
VKIDSYNFGSIVIDGETYTEDIIVSANKLIPNWWREEGHSLSIKDIQGIIDQKCDTLVIGIGFSGAMSVPLETKKHIKSLGIELITQKTSEAVKTYNKLLEEGRKVIGAFHLTC